MTPDETGRGEWIVRRPAQLVDMAAELLAEQWQPWGAGVAWLDQLQAAIAEASQWGAEIRAKLAGVGCRRPTDQGYCRDTWESDSRARDAPQRLERICTPRVGAEGASRPAAVRCGVGRLSPESALVVVWRHYAREFERSRTAAPMPLADRLRMARGAVATAAAELAGVERW